jgi:hypothetical protein
MASKKAKTPQEQALIKKRVEFVQSKPNIPKAQARQQFFVQTRAAELQAKGVEVTKEKRAQLRQKFQSGEVKRSGFYTDADRASFTTGKTGAGSSITTPMSGTTSKQFGTRSVSPAMRQKVSGFKSGNVQASTKSKYTGFEKTLDDFTTQKFVPTVEKYFQNPAIAGINAIKGAFNPKAKQNYNTWAEKEAAKGGVDLGGALNIAITVGQIGASIAQLRRGNTSGVTSILSKAPTFTKPPATRPTGPVTSGLKPSNVTKFGPNYKAPKPKDDFIPGGLDRPIKYNNAPGTKSPRRIKPKGVETKGGPVVSAKTGKPLPAKKPIVTKPAATKPAASKPAATKKTQAQMQAEADKNVSGGLSRALNPKAAPAPKSTGPDMNASNLTFIPAKPTAPKATTQKPAATRPAAKTTRAKAKAGSNFNQKVKNVNKAPQRKIDSKIKKYESQEAFDKFMNSGGRDIVAQAARTNPKVGEAFTAANKEFIAARQTKRVTQETTRTNLSKRRVKAAVRLNRIRANQAAKAAGN